MSNVYHTVVQSLAAHLLSGKSVLHPWSLDSMTLSDEESNLSATAHVFSHELAIRVNFMENEDGEREFWFAFVIYIDNDRAGFGRDGYRHGNSMSIKTEMDVTESAKLADGTSWDAMILKSVEVLERRAFHLSDDLKAIQPRKQINPRKQIRSSSKKA
jgi:hypothetical protein